MAVLIALAGMHLHEPIKPPSTRRMTAEIGDGLRYVWDTKVVRVLVAMVAVMSIFGFSYSVLMPAFAVEVLGVGEAGLGALTAAVGVGALIGSLTVASLTRSRRKGWQLTFGSVLFPIALIAFALSRNFYLSLAHPGLRRLRIHHPKHDQQHAGADARARSVARPGDERLLADVHGRHAIRLAVGRHVGSDIRYIAHQSSLAQASRCSSRSFVVIFIPQVRRLES